MRKKMRGYIYVPLLLSILVTLGFVLSGGLILSEETPPVGKITERYALVDKEASPPNQTLQLSTLDFIAQACGGGGYDIALVIDNSHSVGTNLASMLVDINSFVDSFSGKSTKFSVTKFSDNAKILIRDFTDDLETVKTTISLIGIENSTNWEDALNKAKETLDSPSNRPSVQDLVVFASDGDPNRSNSSGTAIETAVAVANAIKRGGAKIITVGIVGTAGIIEQNLKAISGSTEGVPGTVGTDVILTDFANLGTDLQSIITNICGP